MLYEVITLRHRFVVALYRVEEGGRVHPGFLRQPFQCVGFLDVGRVLEQLPHLLAVHLVADAVVSYNFV